MKVGFVPPVPMEPLLVAHPGAVNLWGAYCLCDDRARYLTASDEAGIGEEISPWGRCLFALAVEMGLEEVYYPDSCVVPDVRRALDLLEARGVRAKRFRFPILRDQERLREALAEFVASLGADTGTTGSLLEHMVPVRMSLKRMDAIQARNAAYPAWHYIATLARALDPRGDLEGMKRDVDKRMLDYQGLAREKWLRLGIVGITPCRPELYAALDELKAAVVYDEWSLENALLSPVQDLTALWHHCSLPYGLKTRQDRVLKEVPARRIQGLIWGVESLRENLREESFFRSAMPVPVLTFENRKSGELSRTEGEGLVRFVERCVAGGRP